MDKITNYEFLAKLEVEKIALLIPKHNGTKESILKMLDVTIEMVTALDKELLMLAYEYITTNNLTSDEAEMVMQINAASLAALMVKADVPGQF